jgi:hypothetical protein
MNQSTLKSWTIFADAPEAAILAQQSQGGNKSNFHWFVGLELIVLALTTMA